MNNDQFMIVNGRTQQSGNATIWAQELSGLEEGERYRFCANFKNLPQCTFDILPVVTLIGANDIVANQTINTDINDPCDWQTIEMVFTAGSSIETIAILLDEMGNGDGNDLAIDDIAVSRLEDQEINLTVTHEGASNTITATVDTSTIDFKTCEYYWFVAEVNSFPPLDIDLTTLTFGNHNGNGPAIPVSSGSPWNVPTTTFPDYNFDPNTLYVVGLFTRECGCFAESFNYQLTFSLKNVEAQLSDEQIEKIKRGVREKVADSLDTTSTTSSLRLFPNPVSNRVNISLPNTAITSIEVYAVSGQQVIAKQYAQTSDTKTIDVSQLKSGIYMVKVLDANNEISTIKMLKD